MAKKKHKQSEPRPLTPKQARFVEEYLIDLNATQAAIRAGFSAKTADKKGPALVGKSSIAAAILAAKEKRQSRTGVDQDWVVTNLKEVVERCMQLAPVLTPNGKQVKEGGKNVWRFDAKNAVAALSWLGKHVGAFTDKHEHTGPAGGPLQVAIIEPPTARIARYEKELERARGAEHPGAGSPESDGPRKPVDP